jgi:serine/threonine-protein kinase
VSELTATERLGRYQLLGPIGSGPCGYVSRAKVFGVAGLERQFALKRILPELTANAEIAQALSVTTRAYATLEHPRIARLAEFTVAAGQTFTAVELVAGLDTGRLAAEARLANQPLAAGGALALISQAARAVGYAHGRGLTHLGLAPTNLIVTVEGDVKVTDFGVLAACLPPRPAESSRLATRVAYLAPEQLAGEPSSAASDVFSLGAIALELVTGQRAFKGDTPQQIAQSILIGMPPEPALPRPIVRVLQRCLARSPFERFPDARALADALDAALRVAPVPGTRKDIGGQVRAITDHLAALNEGELSGMVALQLPTERVPKFDDLGDATGDFHRADAASLRGAIGDDLSEPHVSAMESSTNQFVRSDPSGGPFAPDSTLRDQPLASSTLTGMAPPPAQLPPGLVPAPPPIVPPPAPLPGGPFSTMVGMPPPRTSTAAPADGRPRITEAPPTAGGIPSLQERRTSSGTAVGVERPRTGAMRPATGPQPAITGVPAAIPPITTRPGTGTPPASSTPVAANGEGSIPLPAADEPTSPQPASFLDGLVAQSKEPKEPNPPPAPATTLGAAPPPPRPPLPASRSQPVTAPAATAPAAPPPLAPAAPPPLAPASPPPPAASAKPLTAALGASPGPGLISLPRRASAPIPTASEPAPPTAKRTSPLVIAAASLAVLGGGGFALWRFVLHPTGSIAPTVAVGSAGSSGSRVATAPGRDAGTAVAAKADAATASAADAAAVPAIDATMAPAIDAATVPDAATAKAPIDAATAPDAATAKVSVDAGAATPSHDPTPTTTTGGKDQLVITSKPAGARLFIDGADQGVTPVKLPANPDRHTAALVLAGYDLYVAELDGKGTFAITLKELSPFGGPAGIKVKCKATDRYYIYVDSKPTGQLCPSERIGVQVGAHTVEAYDLVTETRHQFPVLVKDTRLSVRVKVD